MNFKMNSNIRVKKAGVVERGEGLSYRWYASELFELH